MIASTICRRAAARPPGSRRGTAAPKATETLGGGGEDVGDERRSQLGAAPRPRWSARAPLSLRRASRCPRRRAGLARSRRPRPLLAELGRASRAPAPGPPCGPEQSSRCQQSRVDSAKHSSPARGHVSVVARRLAASSRSRQPALGSTTLSAGAHTVRLPASTGPPPPEARADLRANRREHPVVGEVGRRSRVRAAAHLEPAPIASPQFRFDERTIFSRLAKVVRDLTIRAGARGGALAAARLRSVEVAAGRSRWHL